jgi:molybdopterin molybdotransferase
MNRVSIFRKPILVEEAIKRVMAFPQGTKVEHVALEESVGRILAQDVYALHPVPWFTRSPYDGYAIRAESTAEAGEHNPVQLEMLGIIAAGDVWPGEVRKGQAVKIMTGGAIPAGADAVIMREVTKEEQFDEKTFVRIKRKVTSGENICEIGEDMRKGELLARRGTLIHAGIVAVLATFGYEQVPVQKKPTIAIIATGNELLDAGEPLQPGKIRNSNAYMLQAQSLRSGAQPLLLGKVDDTFESTLQIIKTALAEADIVVTTGGVSVGDFDYIPHVYEALGAKLLFNKIGMRPGSVTSAAVLGNKLLFGLSGNPSACYVGFEIFVRPVVRTMLGMEAPYLQSVQAILQIDIAKANPFDRFVRSKLSFADGGVYVAPSGTDKSNIVSSLANANCLMILPGGTRGWEAGSMVQVLLLDEQEGATEWR